MTTASPQPQNHLERQQINQSAWRLFRVLTWGGFKEWVSTEAGRERFMISCVVIVGLVALAGSNLVTYRVAYHDGEDARVATLEAQLAEARDALAREIRENRVRSIKNGCMGMVLMNIGQPAVWPPAPDWCMPILRALPDERPPS